MAGPVSFGYQIAQGGATGPVEFNLQYLVIAGGGGAGASQYVSDSGGGGGAGGYRNSYASETSGDSEATESVIAITADGAGQYYHSAKGMGCRIFMTNKEHICISTGEDHLYYWHANHAGGGSITTATSNWTDVYDAGGGTDDQCSIRLKLWK